MKELSVVILSYNQGRFLSAALDSIVKQGSRGSVEIILIDAASTDETPAVVTRYVNELDKVVSEPDDGPADGLNKGLALASAPFFAYLNADDEWLSGAVESALSAFTENPDIDVLIGNGWKIDAIGNRLKHVRSDPLETRSYAYGYSAILQQATFYRTEKVRLVGGFTAANRTCWDGELLLDLALAGAKTMNISKDLANFRIHEDSISGSGRLNQEYSLDQSRLFEKAIGRPPRSLDSVFRYFGRLRRLQRHIAASLSTRLQRNRD